MRTIAHRLHGALVASLVLALGVGLGAGFAVSRPSEERHVAPPTRAPEPASELAPAPALPPVDTLLDALGAAAPDLDPHVLGLALAAHDHAVARGLVARPNVLTVIDYSRPSTARRFFVFDLPARRLVFEELVAHGKNSGDNLATRFSNAESSLETSLGLFVTGETYAGEHGRSLRLEGLEPGFNDHAEARGIVIHGAAYVSPDAAARLGRLGRSWGCPALSPAVVEPVIDRIQGGTTVFAYYPEAHWLAASRFLAASSFLAPAAGRPT